MSKATRATTIRRRTPSILSVIATIALALVAIASPTHAHPRTSASASASTETAHLGPTTWTKHCRDDPDFAFTIRAKKQKPSQVGCDWLKTKKKGRRKNLCKKSRKETGPRRTISEYCAETCEACKNNDNDNIVLETECPDELPSEESDCSAFVDGLQCDYDYKNTGGCGDGAPVSCYPMKTSTCRKMGGDPTWGLSTFVDLPCVGDRDPDVGKDCDPTASCPETKPVESSGCSDVKPGLSCDYEYVYTGGCGENDPLLCTPIQAYTCEDATWSVATIIPLPCVGDPDPDAGKVCDLADLSK